MSSTIPDASSIVRPSTSSENKSMAPTATFRFLDLPAEIRRIVYSRTFIGSRLELQEPNCDCLALDRQLKCFNDDNFPGILLVSKLVRAEALPIFYAHLIPVTYDVFPSVALEKLPASLLESITTVFIDEQSAELPDTRLLPNLKELRIHLCWDHDAGDVIILYFEDPKNLIVEVAMDDFESKNASWAIKTAREERTVIPYTILVETSIILECHHEHCESIWLPDILIDADGKVISSNVPDFPEHDADCPGRNTEYAGEGSESEEEAEEV